MKMKSILSLCAAALLLLAVLFGFSRQELDLRGTLYQDGPEEAAAFSLRVRRVDRIFGRVTADLELLHKSGHERYACTRQEPFCLSKNITHLDQDYYVAVLRGFDSSGFVLISLYYDKSMEHLVLFHDDFEVNTQPVDQQLLKLAHQTEKRDGKFKRDIS